jgi:hypothetical protein
MILVIVVAVIAVLVAIGALTAVFVILNKARSMSAQIEQLNTSLRDLKDSKNTQTTYPAESSPVSSVKHAPQTRLNIKKTGSSGVKNANPPPASSPFLSSPFRPSSQANQSEEPAIKPIVAEPAPVQEERDINFDCVCCSQNIDAPPVLAGREIICPTCQNRIRVPTRENSKQPLPEPTRGGLEAKTEEMEESARKDATIRLNLGDLSNMPEPTARSITIKRRDIKIRKL